MKKIFFGAFLLLFVCGCTSGLYQWGGYEDNLHRYYDNPDSRAAIITRMEAHAVQLESNSQTVPPGLYAEIGTFYLEMGDDIRAVDFYKKEALAWPESRGFMNALINNLESRQVKKEADDAS